MGKKRNKEEDLSGLYIPMGLFIGLGLGIFLGGRFVPVGLFFGLAGGFFLMMQSQKRHHRKLVRAEQRRLEEEAIRIEQPRQQTKLEEQIQDYSYLSSTLESYKESLARIQKLVSRVPSEKKVLVQDIFTLLEKVYQYVEKEPARYSSVKVFFQTYISSTETILEKYLLLLDQPIMTEEAVQSVKKMDAVLSEMKGEFEEAYVRLYEGDVNQLNVEMEMLRSKFKEEKTLKWK